MQHKVKHYPIFNTESVCNIYSKKDGVPISYVCSTTLLKEGVETYDVFYRYTPHPEFGNKYFGLIKRMSGMFICNADIVEDFEFGTILDDDGQLVYSEHRHDYKAFNNGNMIDGGRSYVRYSGMAPIIYVVRNGEFVPRLTQ